MWISSATREKSLIASRAFPLSPGEKGPIALQWEERLFSPRTSSALRAPSPRSVEKGTTSSAHSLLHVSGEGAPRANEVFLHSPFLPCAARAGEYPKGEGVCQRVRLFRMYLAFVFNLNEALQQIFAIGKKRMAFLANNFAREFSIFFFNGPQARQRANLLFYCFQSAFHKK
jgi:hypothetical protein